MTHVGRVLFSNARCWLLKKPLRWAKMDFAEGPVSWFVPPQDTKPAARVVVLCVRAESPPKKLQLGKLNFSSTLCC